MKIHTLTATRWAVVLALAGLPIAALHADRPSAGTAATSTLTLHIDPQPLSDALSAFAQQSGLQVVFFSEVGKDLRSPRLTGTYSPGEALKQLLANTSLDYTFIDKRTIAIRELKLKSGARSGASLPVESALRLAQSSGQQRPEKTASAEPASRAAADDVDNKPIQEVIVTAQKREERLIDAPQSVSVLSAQYLSRLGAVQFRDFANTVPGMTFATQGAGRTQINLRGITSGVDLGRTVGIYLDDVPYGSSTSFTNNSSATLDVALFDLDRIEVLRGPQGTLYGAATMGGLLKYVSKRPDARAFGGDAQAGVSSTEGGGVGYNVAAAVNAPLVTDKLALRVSGYQSHDGGFIDNTARGAKDVDRSDVYGGRIDLLYTPSDALSIRLGGFVQNISRDGMLAADHTRAGAPVAGELEQRRLFPEPYDQHFRLASGTVSYDMGPATLTSISSFQRERYQLRLDASSIFVGLLTGPPFNFPYSAVGAQEQVSINKFAQELRLASNGTHTLEWLVGAYYTRETADKVNTLPTLDLSGRSLANGLLYLSIPSRYEDLAGFADLTWRLTERFDVTGGLRYVRNDQTVEQIGSGLFGAPRPKRSATEEVFTYLANARYHFADRATGYLRFATGYRPGGPNIVLNDAITGLPLASPTFDADELKSYEAGFKTETAGGLLGVDLSVYYIDWRDMQITAVRSNVGIRTNADDASVRGAELGFTLRPTGNFTVSSALAYVNARLEDPAPDLGGVSGERVPNVPRFAGSLNVDYVFPAGSLQPSIGATVRHVSERMASFDLNATNPQYRLPAYTTLDLRSGIGLGSVDLQLYVHNLLDERGQLSEYNYGGIVQVSLMQPRTFGLLATTHF